MSAPIAVCIPSIGRSELLTDLIEVVLGEGVQVLELWDNAEVLAPHGDVEIVRAPGLTIYEEWNDFARQYGDTHNLAFLNDDIEMASGTLTALRQANDCGWDCASVAARPNVARVDSQRNMRTAAGTFRQGGLNGWAFMVAKGSWPHGGIDPRFKIWYGDDDLFWKMRQDGKRLGVFEGVTVRHEQSTTVNSLPWVPEAQAADAALWRSLCRP